MKQSKPFRYVGCIDRPLKGSHLFYLIRWIISWRRRRRHCPLRSVAYQPVPDNFANIAATLQDYPGKASDKAHRNRTRRWTLRHLIAGKLAGRRFTGSGDRQMLAQHTEGELQRFPQNHLLRWLVEGDICSSVKVRLHFYRDMILA